MEDTETIFTNTHSNDLKRILDKFGEYVAGNIGEQPRFSLQKIMKLTTSFPSHEEHKELEEIETFMKIPPPPSSTSDDSSNKEVTTDEEHPADDVSDSPVGPCEGQEQIEEFPTTPKAGAMTVEAEPRADPPIEEASPITHFETPASPITHIG